MGNSKHHARLESSLPTSNFLKFVHGIKLSWVSNHCRIERLVWSNTINTPRVSNTINTPRTGMRSKKIRGNLIKKKQGKGLRLLIIVSLWKMLLLSKMKRNLAEKNCMSNYSLFLVFNKHFSDKVFSKFSMQIISLNKSCSESGLKAKKYYIHVMIGKSLNNTHIGWIIIMIAWAWNKVKTISVLNVQKFYIPSIIDQHLKIEKNEVDVNREKRKGMSY